MIFLAPEVPIRVKQGQVRLPSDPSMPIIMVGPGTGCAMFRAMLEERSCMSANSGILGSNSFFFGCRHASKDFLHEEQWQRLLTEGHLTLFDVAFSRDQSHKVYVQHKIREHSKELWALLQAGANIYVSGSSTRMPIDVREAFVEVVQREGNMDDSQADQFIQKLEKSNKYQVETWS